MKYKKNLNYILNTVNQIYKEEFLNVDILQEGCDNDVFLLETNTNKFVLRISKRTKEEKSKEDFLFELQILQTLSEANFPVPKVLPTANKDKVIIVEGRYAIITEYIDGINITLNVENKPNIDIVRKASCLLAKLHKNLSSNKLELKHFNKRNIFTELEKILEKKDLIYRTFINSKDIINNCEKYLKWGRDHLKIDGIIHNDFRAKNLLVDKDTSDITAILDFDWSCHGSFIKDLGLALTEWSFPDKASSYWSDIYDSFLEVYENEMGINIDKKQLNKWICFNCLSDTATYILYVLDSVKDISSKQEIESYMYYKFQFFNKFNKQIQY